MIRLNKEGKDIFTLSFGSVIAQLIPVIASLILAHIYDAEQYGNWGVFLSYTGILSIIITGQYEMAIVRPDKDSDARAIVRLCMMIGCALTILITLLIYAFDTAGLSYVRELPCKYLLPIYVLGLGMIQIYIHYANRKERYKVIAMSGIVRNSFQAVSRISLGLLHSFYGLIVGAFAGVVSAVVYSEWRTPIRKIVFGRHDWKRIRANAVRYRYFPMFLMPSALLNALSTNLPLLILNEYFAKEYIGYFSMTIGLLFLPVQLLGNAMGKIFYKKSSEADNINGTKTLSFNLLKVSFGLGVLMNIIIIPLGEPLFAFVLGETWRTAGTYAILLSPWILMTLCFSPLSVIFDSKDKQHIELILNFVLFCVRVFAVWFGGKILQDINQTIFLYGLFGFVIWAIEGYIIIRIIGLKFSFRQKSLIFGTLSVIVLLWIFRTIHILC